MQCSKGIEQISSLDLNRLSGLISNSFASLNQIQNIPYSIRRLIVPPIIFNKSNKFRSSYFHDNRYSEGKKKYKIFFLGRANASHKNIILGLIELNKVFLKLNLELDVSILTAAEENEIEQFLKILLFIRV